MASAGDPSDSETPRPVPWALRTPVLISVAVLAAFLVVASIVFSDGNESDAASPQPTTTSTTSAPETTTTSTTTSTTTTTTTTTTTEPPTPVVQVIDQSGGARSAAEAALMALGLTVEIEEIPLRGDGVGTVIEQSPASGVLDEGSTVVLTVGIDAPSDCNDERADDPVLQFADLVFGGEDREREAAVSWVVNRGIMTPVDGVGGVNFGGSQPATRGMLASVLHRYFCTPQPYARAGFVDVPANAFYERAADWVAGRGILTGTGPQRFDPDQQVTRDQWITAVWRALLSPDPPGGIDVPYTDVTDGFFVNALRWSIDNDLDPGRTLTVFGADDVLTRLDVAELLFDLERQIDPIAALALKDDADVLAAVEVVSSGPDASRADPVVRAEVEIQVPASVGPGDRLWLSGSSETLAPFAVDDELVIDGVPRGFCRVRWANPDACWRWVASDAEDGRDAIEVFGLLPPIELTEWLASAAGTNVDARVEDIGGRWGWTDVYLVVTRGS